jgi:hypothetical protein
MEYSKLQAARLALFPDEPLAVLDAVVYREMEHAVVVAVRIGRSDRGTLAINDLKAELNAFIFVASNSKPTCRNAAAHMQSSRGCRIL